jgi:putative serine protease PepD
MEDLTKTQIILLTLLISFVTSIATGIITTSLLAEAPAGVTQTINRVVEHTIERVTPAASNGTGSTKEVTIINEDDAVTSSISKAQPSIVRIQTPIGPTQDFYAVGVIVSKSGLVLTDKHNLILNSVYNITLADGSVLSAAVSHINDSDNIATFQIQPDATHNNNFPFVSISQTNIQLGQTVIGIEGKTKNSVQIGRATSLNTRPGTDAKGKTITVTYGVETDIRPSTETAGAPLFNLSGDLVGIKSSASDATLNAGTYITFSPIIDLINSK